MNVEPEAVVVDAAAERREKDRLRKQKERKLARESKEAALGIMKATTPDEFWEANRKKLSPDQLNTLQERESAVLDLCANLRGYISGVIEVLDDEDRTWLAETIAQVQAEIRQHGITDVDKVLFCFYTFDGEFHFNAATFNAVVQSGGAAAAAFAQFGFLISLPIHIVRDWERLLRECSSPRAVQSVPTEEQVILRCESPGCADPGRAVPKSTADRYRALKIKYFCHNCLALERRSASQATIRIGRETVVDGFGKARPDLTDPHYLLYGKGD